MNAKAPNLLVESCFTKKCFTTSMWL